LIYVGLCIVYSLLLVPILTDSYGPTGWYYNDG